MASSDFTSRASSLAGEALGVALLLSIGEGFGAIATLLPGNYAIWQVAIAWGVGLVLAIHVASKLSNAHLNPAVSIALHLDGSNKMTATDMALYLCGQFIGAFAAAALVYGCFRSHIESLQRDGTTLSMLTGASIFACYFPPPGNTYVDPYEAVTPQRAFFLEFLATASLLVVIKAMAHEPANDPQREQLGLLSRPAPKPSVWLPSSVLGVTLAILIVLIAPMTQCCLNPCRDLAPRVLLWLCGYGQIAFPGPRKIELWLYMVAPTAGAIAGAFGYNLVVRLKEQQRLKSKEESEPGSPRVARASAL
ncbi:unnamed protein product [Vitrella brassicaformis CCMP3155]|uniref:Aquaporin n=1 Tax=Vitrella brassicaformis (strain CCMP3155) TaxID=1169540 RepID=A0A0G4FK16_VITBC|nr:unnamed protein product [Vitrella brassicaformis CCMP3155]|mmetsp:Transcript_22442/g.55314  ORF Transcript_22442/g.55314 Transcript_22442/m.55314 type:complete len:307 (-) Transcript_22442:806-1726(-)|eukprot:CEM13731.1 unnamed protein product [Vitrella brassicaformis CCMP3155]